MKVCGIYKITNIINGKTLIGQSWDVYKRLGIHRRLATLNQHHNPHFQNAWHKYGERSFKMEGIFLCPIQDLDEAEINFIRNYKSLNSQYGYNVLSGGRRHKHTEETKRKIAEAESGNKNWNYGGHHSKEAIQKMKNTHKAMWIGKGGPMCGKKHSQDTKDKISKSHKGVPLSEEHKQKLSELRKGMVYETRRGVPLSEEHKRKLSISHKGVAHMHQRGVPLSKEHKRKLSESHKGINKGIKFSEERKLHMTKAWKLKNGTSQKLKAI